MKQVIEDFIYKKIVRGVLLMSKLGRQSVLGEASTGYNFDYMYVNRPNGYYGIGKIIDFFLLRLPAVQATRERKNNIIQVLRGEIQQRKIEGKQTKIVDVACGAGRYLAELNAAFNQEKIEIIGVDYDTKSLKLGRSIAESYNVPEISLRFFRGNVFRLERLRKFGTKIDWRPNIIVASGFVEYLDDKQVQRSFKEVHEGLDQSGLFLFVSQQSNPSRKLMEKVCTTDRGSWVLNYRQPTVLYDWLRQSGFRDIHVHTDRWNMYNLFTIRK